MTMFTALSTGLRLALIPLLFACSDRNSDYPELLLDGFSDGNYVQIMGNIGNAVCVTGDLSIDSMGVYFPLQPIERDGVIDIGFSRINTNLSFDYASGAGLQHQQTYTVCGILRDATPFEQCDSRFCKWYELRNAVLRPRLP